MNDLRIAIAVEDTSLRKLVYALLPWAHPENLWEAYDIMGPIAPRIDGIERLIDGSRTGIIELIIIDWAFQFKHRPDAGDPLNVPPSNRIEELVATNLPMVALMPRLPTYPDSAPENYEQAAKAAGATLLDLPTTVPGMESAIKQAIDSHERPHGSTGPDYGKTDFGDITKAQKIAWGNRVRVQAREKLTEYALAEAARIADASDEPLDSDPMDDVIEAAKAVVAKTNHGVGTAVYPNHDLIPKAIVALLKTALWNAGYGDA